MKQAILPVWLILLGVQVLAQAPADPLSGSSLQDPIESMTEQADHETEDLYWEESLSIYQRHPLNLNEAGPEELSSFPLFSTLQISALLEHRARFGKLISLEELQVIDEFDPASIKKIQPFVTLGLSAGQTGTVGSVFLKGKNSLLLRMQKIVESQAGYTNDHATANQYPGNNEKILLKYNHQVPGKFRIGITGEKDPGEDFFSGQQKQGFDFYSAYIMYQGKTWLKKIILGDYAIQAGQGLALWSGFSSGKSGDAMAIQKNAAGIVPYTSTDENKFLRGMAVSAGKGFWRVDVFGSSHKLDANLAGTVTDRVISSFQETGYHRTQAELEARHAANEMVMGSMLRFSTHNLRAGTMAYVTKFSNRIQKDNLPYRRFEFTGESNSNVSAWYDFNFHNASLFAEVARSSSAGWAYLQGCLIQLHPRVSASLLLRSYDRSYQALRSAGFGENTLVENEQGSYFGINFRLPKGVSVNTYLDVFRFPWLKYQVDAPSSGIDFLAQLNWMPRKKFETSLRYRSRTREENPSMAENEFLHALVQAVRSDLRWSARMNATEAIELTARTEWSHWKKAGAPSADGYLVYADLVIHPIRSRYTVSFRYAVFDCKEYETRIYAFERDVLFSYSIPAYQGSGIRYYVNLRYGIRKGADLWLRWARTSYDQVTEIGSGLDLIRGHTKTDVKAEVRFQF